MCAVLFPGEHSWVTVSLLPTYPRLLPAPPSHCPNLLPFTHSFSQADFPQPQFPHLQMEVKIKTACSQPTLVGILHTRALCKCGMSIVDFIITDQGSGGPGGAVSWSPTMPVPQL
jgi:hypothetical protein